MVNDNEDDEEVDDDPPGVYRTTAPGAGATDEDEEDVDVDDDDNHPPRLANNGLRRRVFSPWGAHAEVNAPDESEDDASIEALDTELVDEDVDDHDNHLPGLVDEDDVDDDDDHPPRLVDEDVDNDNDHPPSSPWGAHAEVNAAFDTDTVPQEVTRPRMIVQDGIMYVWEVPQWARITGGYRRTGSSQKPHWRCLGRLPPAPRVGGRTKANSRHACPDPAVPRRPSRGTTVVTMRACNHESEDNSTQGSDDESTNGDHAGQDGQSSGDADSEHESDNPMPHTPAIMEVDDDYMGDDDTGSDS